MANLIKVAIPAITVIGDNASTSLVLRLGEYPFDYTPPGVPVSVVFLNHPFDLDTVSIIGKDVVVEFEQPIATTSALSFAVTYDPS